MGEDGHAGAQARKRVWRGVALGLALCLALLLLFHRPLLRAVARQAFHYYAAREHLAAQFQLEGSILGDVVVRGLHVTSTRPGAIESIDVDLARLDYSLVGLLLHGPAGFLQTAEARSIRVVVNPGAPPVRPKARERPTLPSLFPKALRLTDATIVIRSRPHDFAIEHVDLSLDPRQEGELRIASLQLPSGHRWTNVRAPTSYRNKNLIVRDLVLDRDDQFRSINIDGSHIAEKNLVLNLDATVGLGVVTAAARLQETATSLDATLRIRAGSVAASALNKYLGTPEGYFTGAVDRLDVDLAGALDKPRSWRGSAALNLTNPRQPNIGFDRVTCSLDVQTGRAMLREATVVQGGNELHVRGSAELPHDPAQLDRANGTFEISGVAMDLAALTSGLPQRFTGSARLSGKIDIRDGKLTADVSASAGTLGFSTGSVENLTALFRATTPLRQSAPAKPWFDDLSLAGELHVAGGRYRDYAIDSADIALGVDHGILRLERLNVRRKANQLSAAGQYQLPADPRHAALQDGELNCTFDAPELSDFWLSDADADLRGPLELSAQLRRRSGVATGQATLYGADVRLRDLRFKNISAQCTIWNNIVYLNDFTAALNERDFVSATGTLGLNARRLYSGKVVATIVDLSTVTPLLRASGNDRGIGGSLSLSWQGEGSTGPFRHSGKLQLNLERGRYGNAQSLQAKVDASYSPEGLDVPVIFVGSDKMDFQATARTAGDTLEISKIQLDQGTEHYAQGYVAVPLIWKNLGTSAAVSPSNGNVIVNFESQELDIAKVFSDLGAKPPVSGTLNVKLDARGTLANVVGRLELQLRELRSERLPNLEPATFDLAAEAQHDQLAINGKLQQAKIQPLELTANLPLRLTEILRQRKVPDDTPVTAKLRLPRSSVNFVRQFIPAVQELDGDAALDVDVAGTIGRPEFRGSGDITINVARAQNVTLPALQNFKGRLGFANDALTLEECGGELSGGRFSASGRVTFPKLTQANLDLQVRADSALVARNDTLTARTDADLKITGPLTGASVTGTINLTNSQVLKNLDLIPIGLPGRPAPQPPAARPEFSFPDPPLRDWKFDVAIKTKDPVLIRGSLANGGAVADLHLGGTGLHPQLDGMVRLDNVDATLPFSRLEISSGFVYFDPTDSFNPRLDLHGTSVIHDYTIHVYIYGTALQPEAVFTSEPPLPQEEIISLLATGTTREELTASNNVLAGRAAMLLVQQLYRKVFKKGQPTQTNSAFDRLDVDIGTVDPRTGQQQATARFKVNDQLVLVGDIGVGGDYRGMVKYLIRFR